MAVECSNHFAHTQQFSSNRNLTLLPILKVLYFLLGSYLISMKKFSSFQGFCHSPAYTDFTQVVPFMRGVANAAWPYHSPNTFDISFLSTLDLNHTLLHQPPTLVTYFEHYSNYGNKVAICTRRNLLYISVYITVN